MALACMARADENALICDMAETYHVLDWRALPARLAATLAAGLRDDSRIKLALTGCRVPAEMMLQAVTADAVRMLLWLQTKDGAKGRNRPASMLASLQPSTAESAEGFDSPEDFMRWRAKMTGGEADG